MKAASMAALKDRHKGDRGFIVGNGPSLREMDLELLQGEISFGLNACARFFTWTSWRPTYWVADTTVTMDPHHVPFSIIANEAVQESFIFHDAPDQFDGYRLAFIHAEVIDLQSEYGLPLVDWWSDDPTVTISRYGTISFAALQIAVYLGLDPIYVIGMDLGFKGHAELGQDPNHADPNYNLPQIGMDWRGVLESHTGAHSLARENADRLGIEIINASDGGGLEVYPRVNFGSLFNGRAPK